MKRSSFVHPFASQLELCERSFVEVVALPVKPKGVMGISGYIDTRDALHGYVLRLE